MRVKLRIGKIGNAFRMKSFRFAMNDFATFPMSLTFPLDLH